MITLQRYLDIIVEPTFKDFQRNPTSIRHGYLACVATYHAVDRAAYPEEAQVLAEQWREESQEFMLIEEVAMYFKHGQRRWVKKAKEKKPDALLITHPLGLEGDGEGLELHSLYFLIRDAINFLREKAAEQPREPSSQLL
jgi:hypothetical protein